MCEFVVEMCAPTFQRTFPFQNCCARDSKTIVRLSDSSVYTSKAKMLRGPKKGGRMNFNPIHNSPRHEFFINQWHGISEEEWVCWVDELRERSAELKVNKIKQQHPPPAQQHIDVAVVVGCPHTCTSSQVGSWQHLCTLLLEKVLSRIKTSVEFSEPHSAKETWILKTSCYCSIWREILLEK